MAAETGAPFVLSRGGGRYQSFTLVGWLVFTVYPHPTVVAETGAPFVLSRGGGAGPRVSPWLVFTVYPHPTVVAETGVPFVLSRGGGRSQSFPLVGVYSLPPPHGGGGDRCTICIK